MDFNAFKSITIGTDNILDDEEFKKSKNPIQEILTCIKSRVSELKQNSDKATENDAHLIAIPSEAKNLEVDTTEGKTKTVVKIFLNEFFDDTIEESLRYTLDICKTPNVILAFAPASKIENEKFIWGENDTKSKDSFKYLWSKLRELKKTGKISALGISDMDLDTIKDIFDDGNYDFTILQINIVTCCVPPPALVDFCKQNEIQLLTHSDPQIIFPSSQLEELNLKAFKVKWVVRYLETLVCRGILTKKGFIVNFQNLQI